MRLLAVSLCSWLSICLFNAGHRIPEALFFTVWEGGRPGPTREDWHVSWPGSVYARSWTDRRDAGRGIPQLQVLDSEHGPARCSSLLFSIAPLLLYIYGGLTVLYVIYTPYLAMKNLLHVPELRTSSSYPASSGLMNLWLWFFIELHEESGEKTERWCPWSRVRKAQVGH